MLEFEGIKEGTGDILKCVVTPVELQPL